MSNRGLTKTYSTSAPVPRRTIVHFTADRTVAPASSSVDLLVGVSDYSADAPAGRRVDVHRDGIVECIAGGPIGRGQPLTSDANGHAIVAVDPAPGNPEPRIIGFAEVDAAIGDFFDVFLDQS